MRAATLAGLAVAVVVAATGWWWLQRDAERRPPSPEGEGPLLPAFADNMQRVTGVRAVRGGGQLLAHAVRRGEAWVVANRWDYPADRATLRTTLRWLARARRVTAKADRPPAYADLGVAPLERAEASTLALTVEGLAVPTVIAGNAAAGGAAGTYARLAGEPRAWHVRPTFERPDRIADWLDERLVDIAAERVAEVRIEPAAGRPVRVTRPDGPEGPFRLQRPAGREPLSASTARSLARVVTGLTLVDVRPVDRVEALAHRATARYTTFDGLAVELAIYSGEGDDAGHYARLRARAADTASADVAERARMLGERWAGWAYSLPDYKRTNASRTRASVLKE
jgi:hypothetical protein